MYQIKPTPDGKTNFGTTAASVLKDAKSAEGRQKIIDFLTARGQHVPMDPSETTRVALDVLRADRDTVSAQIEAENAKAEPDAEKAKAKAEKAKAEAKAEKPKLKAGKAKPKAEKPKAEKPKAEKPKAEPKDNEGPEAEPRATARAKRLAEMPVSDGTHVRPCDYRGHRCEFTINEGGLAVFVDGQPLLSKSPNGLWSSATAAAVGIVERYRAGADADKPVPSINGRSWWHLSGDVAGRRVGVVRLRTPAARDPRLPEAGHVLLVPWNEARARRALEGRAAALIVEREHAKGWLVRFTATSAVELLDANGAVAVYEDPQSAAGPFTCRFANLTACAEWLRGVATSGYTWAGLSDKAPSAYGLLLRDFWDLAAYIKDRTGEDLDEVARMRHSSPRPHHTEIERSALYFRQCKAAVETGGPVVPEPVDEAALAEAASA